MQPLAFWAKSEISSWFECAFFLSLPFSLSFSFCLFIFHFENWTTSVWFVHQLVYIRLHNILFFFIVFFWVFNTFVVSSINNDDNSVDIVNECWIHYSKSHQNCSFRLQWPSYYTYMMVYCIISKISIINNTYFDQKNIGLKFKMPHKWYFSLLVLYLDRMTNERK